MGSKKMFRNKRTPFEELWKKVEGIPEGIKRQISDDLSQRTKRILENHTPKEIEEAIKEALSEVDKGSIETIDTLLRKVDLKKEKRKKITIYSIVMTVILLAFIIINIEIDILQKRRLSFVVDSSQYCYGIDSFEEKDNSITLKGWFIELKSVRKKTQSVSSEQSEVGFALVPLEETAIGGRSDKAVFMDVITMFEYRPEVNDYFSCEYDYSKCGFTASVNSEDINLMTTAYRLAVRPDVSNGEAILVNVYITDKGVVYTDPLQSPELKTEGTDLDKVVKEGVRLVSRPDYGCYVYQLQDKLYWIAEEDFAFNDNGRTLIQYQIDTTQFNKLPLERIKNDWFWSNNGDTFENHEITNLMNCGKYRVSVRSIPLEYSVTNVLTGYNNGDWVWAVNFKPCYAMIINKSF